MSLFSRMQQEFRKKVKALSESIPYHEKLIPLSHRHARDAWEEEIRRRNSWRYLCARGTCDDCGFRPCRCDVRPTRRFIVDQMRKLAGIHPATGYGDIRHEWLAWSAGKEGPRKCGPSSWDNSVRAYEEDR